MQSLFDKALTENKLILKEDAKSKLLHYLDLLKTWNQVFNLTSITDPKEMIYLHLIDSLIIAPFLKGPRLLDVGTGAGLPGIPLAILHPEHHWVLLDKNSKKTRFLTQVIAELKLTNVESVHERSENFHTQQGFDSILSRALGSLQLFTETTQHLLNKEGVLLAMKGKYPDEELAQLAPDFRVVDITALEIKGMKVERHLVRINATVSSHQESRHE